VTWTAEKGAIDGRLHLITALGDRPFLVQEQIRAGRGGSPIGGVVPGERVVKWDTRALKNTGDVAERREYAGVRSIVGAQELGRLAAPGAASRGIHQRFFPGDAGLHPPIDHPRRYAASDHRYRRDHAQPGGSTG